MEYGLALCRFALLSEDEHRLFALTLHHAIFDGWSLGLIMRTLSRFYNGETPSQVALVPYVDFVNYATSLNTSLADEYWRTQLKGATRPTFPRVQAVSGQSPALPPASKSFSHKMSMRTHSSSSITRATVLRAAWAIVLARYNDDSDDITFGAAVAGRQAPVAGIGEMVGPVISTVPVRVKLSSQQSVLHYLRDIQVQGIEMVPFEQTGLQNIAKLSPDAHDACDLATLFVIQPQIIVRATSSSLFEPLESSIEPGDSSFTLAGYFTYPLVMQCHLWDSEVLLEVTFDTSVLCIEQIERLARQYEYVVHQLLATEARGEPACLLGSVTMCGPKDIEEMKGWNISMETDEVSSCFHTLVEEQARQRPTAPAIAAWDGDFSYSELNATAERLAHHLVTQMRVTRGDLVMLCFEKSAWAYVAMLAINKAGGAWVPLDPTHPSHRHQQVIDQAGARLALASVEHADKCRKMLGSVVEVSPALDNMLAETPKSVGTPLRDLASPRDAAYVLFTSGTTGTPKGIVMEHRALCTSQVAIGRRLGLEAERVRLLQFAAYVFDLSIGEIIGPLISGACVCVPSEHERINDLAGFIRRAGVNWAFLTPSVVRLFKPEDVPGLELLLLTGEAAGHDQLATWIGRVRLLNGWGPSETCCFSTLHEWQTAMESPMTVGRPVGGYCWIVAADDWERLAPVGCIGEVVIQGPTIAREYLAYPEGTAANFITGLPAWALKTDQAPYSRFYRSGDLAYYNPDGTIEFVARRDTQVKIRGFRVELGEVEHHVREGLAGVQQVVVDVLEAKTRGGVPSLSASREMSALMSRLSVRLPSYMVPTVYVPVRYMPCTTSQKVDRRKLRSTIEHVGSEDLLIYKLSNAVKEAPTTEMEARLQTLWGLVLGLATETIGRNDSFLHLGGDSVAAIRLIGAAREAGIILRVENIFENAQLSSVALHAVKMEAHDMLPEIKPFSLLPGGQVNQMQSQIREQCGLSDGQFIKDAYPCTSLQEGLMALAVKQPGSYMAKWVYRVPVHVDMDRFRAAWERTIKLCPNLSTRIVTLGDTSLQASITNDIMWESSAGISLRTFMSTTSALKMGYGSRLCRYAIVQDTAGERYFVLIIHHAVFDGWSLELVLRALKRIYNRGDVPAAPLYANFIHYTMSIDHQAACDYWTNQLNGARRATFPPTVSLKESATVTRVMKTTIPIQRKTNSSITTASILRVAWAIVLARYCESDDICFLTTVSGRHAPVSGVEAMLGPTVATVPVHLRFARQQTVAALLRQAQAQAAEMSTFEQFGLRNISSLGPQAKELCDASSLMIIQPMQSMECSQDMGEDVLAAPGVETYTVEEALDGYFTYSLVIQIETFNEHVGLNLTYHANVLSEAQLQILSRHFAHVVQQILTKDDQPLGTLSLAGEWDLRQAVDWNGKEAAPVQACIHDLIAQQAIRSASREAVLSSEGSLSYRDLECMSTHLAAYLSQIGVGLEMMVPICFEKSMWAIIAMLGVMKAGGAFVPMDPSHPGRRHQAIVKEVDARIMLVSRSTASICRGLVEHTVELSETLMAQLQDSIVPVEPPPLQSSPRNAAFVIFTSGSTGLPKSIVIEHSALCTSVASQGKVFGIDQEARVLQFSSYVFDVSIAEIFTTLVFGGAVCVPAESQRLQNIAEFITSTRVNVAMLTPSFANTFTPTEVPTLRTLVLGGEAPTQAVLNTWHGKVKLINGYGPAETCIYALTYEYRSIDDSPAILGKTTYGSCWIVDPDDYERLAPIGCVGELLIRGHGLARGYAKNGEETNKSFINSVKWLSNPTPNHVQRYYKTGDLVRYRSDGMVEFIGRRDTQVKLRGQRIELGAIESNIQQALAVIEHVAVDVVHRESRETLVAFITFSTGTSATKAGEVWDPINELLEIDEIMRTMLNALVSDLKAILPLYMVPNVLLPFGRMPFGTSMKIDRRRLREFASGLTQERLATFILETRTWLAPTTAMQSRMREIWAKVLTLPVGTIGRDDSFLQLGGDSITAIRLVSTARAEGIQINVSSIFQDPRLSQVAASAGTSEVAIEEPLQPWSFVHDSQRPSLESDIRQQCSPDMASAGTVTDVYPTTALQEGLMALAVKQPGSYMARFTFELAAGVETERFKAAWERTVQACAVLRSRIVLSGGRSWQVVIDEELRWRSAEGVDAHMAQEVAQPMKYGSALCRFALLHEGEHQLFGLTMHHAVFDGWSLGLIMGALSRFYDGDMSAQALIAPYVGFVKYAHEIDMSLANDYWCAQLKGAIRPIFPQEQATSALSSVSPPASKSFSHTIALTSHSSSTITRATILRAAWAIVLARYNDGTDDITFGAAVAGRQAPVVGVERMVGPVISTVPVRVRLSNQQPVVQYLRDVQTQGAKMIPFEQTGLQNIAKLGPDAREACGFSTLFVIQPRKLLAEMHVSLFVPPSTDVAAPAEVDLTTYFTYPLVMQCHLDVDEVVLQFTFNPMILSAVQLETIARQYEHVVKQLLLYQFDDAGAATLDDISVSGSGDTQQVLRWNAEVSQPTVIDACVHDMITETASRTPHQEAIFAWDGRCTYMELDQMTTKLAIHLRELGVGIESLVPVCFEKSMWTVVAMLAIMKAGGTFVPINPSQPLARRQALVAGLSAPLMLASKATANACEDMLLPVLHVSASLLSTISPTVAFKGQTATPGNAAYVLFTSGSTGTPKGVVMEHSALASTLVQHGSRIRLSRSSRVLQFSSYVFDVSVSEIFATLLFGGSVCVPSEEDRIGNLAAFINRARVDYAMLTPSFASTLTPARVPSVRTIVLAGEAPTLDNVSTWASNVILLNNYGPAEACISSSVSELKHMGMSQTTIGRGCNTTLWIVEPDDHDRLTPVGCIGELLIQGPGLAREYLNDPEKTACSFIHSPSWLPPGPFTRLYKTGDLARYNEDGTIDFVGRKDAQIKIRGQRMEPGEVEYQIKRLLPIAVQVAVTLDPTPSRSNLVAFICIKPQRHADKCTILSMTGSLRQTLVALVEELATQVPAYMVPVYCIPLTLIPKTTSEKVDRKFLHEILAGLTTQEISVFSTDKKTEFCAPTTRTESSLRTLWSQILGINEISIGVDDNFYRLGGDSIKIVTLVELVRRQYEVSLSRTLLNSTRTTIRDIASYIAKSDGGTERDEAGPRIDLLAEFNELWADIHMPHIHLQDHWRRALPQGAHVFLTGGTGYLGTHILKGLVQHPQICRITILVRAKDQSHALARVKRSACLAKWWREEYMGKIQVWTGDLGRLGFGLTQRQLEMLNGRSESQCVDAIVHNGAAVEWTADYSILRPINADSTVQLLNVMLSSPARPKMIYISGGAIADMADRNAAVETFAHAIGYSQTKFLSETLVRECTTHLPGSQNMLSTVKPGIIIGSPEQGVANTDDLVWRLVASAARIGAYPGEPLEHWVAVSDTDAVTDTILSQLTVEILNPFLKIDTGVPVSIFWHTIESALESRLQSVSWHEWISMARLDLTRVGETHPLWPVQQFLGRLGTVRQLSRPTIGSETERVKESLKKNVAYLLAAGLIFESSRSYNSELEPGFTRSKRLY
nr:nonribosomal peptide synthetase easa [Quercus suber]